MVLDSSQSYEIWTLNKIWELSLELDKIVLQLWSVLDCILQYTLVKWRMRHSGETTFYFCTVLNPFHDNQMMIWLHIQVSFWDFKMIEWLWQYLEPTQRWLTTQKSFHYLRIKADKLDHVARCCHSACVLSLLSPRNMGALPHLSSSQSLTRSSILYPLLLLLTPHIALGT